MLSPMADGTTTGGRRCCKRCVMVLVGLGMLQLGAGGATSPEQRCYPSQLGLLQRWPAVLPVVEGGAPTNGGRRYDEFSPQLVKALVELRGSRGTSRCGMGVVVFHVRRGIFCTVNTCVVDRLVGFVF